jgi:hypothetical protein
MTSRGRGEAALRITPANSPTKSTHQERDMTPFAMFHRSVPAVLLLLALTAHASAQATKPADTPDEAAARAAAKAFVMTLGEDDPAKARALFAGTAEDAKSVDQMHGAIKRLARLAAAVEKRWPDAKNLRSNDMTPAGMAARFDHAPIRLTGDQATFPDGPLLKKIDGKWRIIDIFPNAQSRKQGQTMFVELSAVVDETLPEIEQGKYATAADVEKALSGRMMKRMQEKMALPPATRPAK